MSHRACSDVLTRPKVQRARTDHVSIKVSPKYGAHGLIQLTQTVYAAGRPRAVCTAGGRLNSIIADGGAPSRVHAMLTKLKAQTRVRVTTWSP